MGRFTLVELMIVVAIIAILAAIAVPNFVAMQYESKTAELGVNVDGVEKAVIAYGSAYGDFLMLNTFDHPAANPGKQKNPWTTGSDFDTIEWAPDGDVYGTYTIEPSGSGAPCRAGEPRLLVEGKTDVDGDDTDRQVAHWICNASMTIQPTMTGPWGCLPAASKCY